MVGSILNLPGRKLRLWGRRGEGGYISLVKSTGVALYNRGGQRTQRGETYSCLLSMLESERVGDVFETLLV